MRVPPTARAKSRRPSRPFRRPAVEMLEDRSVPSAYTFARLTDAQSGAFQPDPTSAAINNGGAVAFIANLPDGVNKGIFLARGGSITTIVQSGPAPGFTDIGGPVSVNDAGVVAFTAVAGNTWGLYTSDGVTTRLLVQTGATFPINFQNPVINNAGAVAFYALEQTGPGTLTPGIFLASGGTVRTLVLGSPTFNLSGHFDLNNNGQVAFTTEDSQAHANVYVTDGTTLTPVALFGASLSPGFRDLAINDGGTVAFTAGIPGGTAVLTGNGGPLTTVATDTSHLVSFSNPVVNNVGDVAFVTRFSGGSTGQVVFGTGIYDGSSPTANKVIARPDPLDGLTFVQPLGGLAMNDTGQIGFVGQISNFTPTGNYDEVFRADPVLPAVSIGNATVTEGNSGMTNATFSVTLSGPLNKTVTVGYATADGTATAADNDYGPASGTLTFAPGETAKTVTVPVTGDARVEPDETFTVALSNPVHATIAAGTGTGTIRNDDVLPYTVTNTNDSGPGSLRQALLNANAAAGPVTIDFRIPATDPNFVDVDSALPGGDAAPDVFVIQPLTALPALNNPNAGITLDGRTQAAFGGDTNPFGPDVDLDGSVLTSGNGLRLLSNNNAVFGLDISRFLGNGIFINGGSSNNWVAGNYIGTDATGTVARGNAANGSAAGVRISGGGTGNVIGTNGDGLNDAAERNVISGNRGPATTGIAAGVDITGVGTAGNVVAGNYIGTDATGTVALGNSTQGVLIEAGASSNRVVGNVISGNGGQGESGGVLIVHGNTDDNVLTGNFIGTNAAGTAPLGNLGFGVRIRGGEPTAPVPGPNHGNRIGTNADGVGDAAERNLISGNQGNGVEIFGDSTNDLVAGNYIGTDVTGTAALGNAAGGVENRSSSTTVGGAAGAGNLVSGNGGAGVVLHFASASGAAVAGNLVGTDVTGTKPLGNAGNGVELDGAVAGSLIGGDAARGNTIAFNGGAGVAVLGSTATGNTIRADAIFANGGLGIDLGGDGVTANDPGDADAGANGLQNFPLFTARTGAGTRVAGSFRGAPGVAVTLDFYAGAAPDPSGFGEGQRYLGSAAVSTDATGLADFDVTLGAATATGEVVTATATGADGSTSEFSPGQQPAAGVAAIAVNQGQAQRSMVTRIDVTFSGLVTVDPSAFRVTRAGGGDPGAVNVAVATVGGQTVVTLTFAGANVVAGSVRDGRYTLSIDAGKVRDANGLRLDGDGDGLAGGDGQASFFRLFGDTNGNGILDTVDYAVFRSTIQTHSYLWYLDADGSGTVDAVDYSYFRLGRSV